MDGTKHGSTKTNKIQMKADKLFFSYFNIFCNFIANIVLFVFYAILLRLIIRDCRFAIKKEGTI